MEKIPEWQLKFFQNFSHKDLCDLIDFLISVSLTERNVRSCSDNSHFCSKRTWLKRAREKIKDFQSENLLEMFQQFPGFLNIGLLKILMQYFGDTYVSEEWGKKRLLQIRELIRKHRQRLNGLQTLSEDGRHSFPRFIKKGGLGRVKVLPHAVKRFKERALDPSPQSLIEFFHQSSPQDLSESERKKREIKHGEGARFYSYPSEFLRFVVIFNQEKYNYDGWVLKTVEVDTNLAHCSTRHPGFCSFDK